MNKKIFFGTIIFAFLVLGATLLMSNNSEYFVDFSVSNSNPAPEEVVTIKVKALDWKFADHLDPFIVHSGQDELVWNEKASYRTRLWVFEEIEYQWKVGPLGVSPHPDSMTLRLISPSLGGSFDTGTVYIVLSE